MRASGLLPSRYTRESIRTLKPRYSSSALVVDALCPFFYLLIIVGFLALRRSIVCRGTCYR